MVRVVVDTNVLLNAILPTSSNYWLFEQIIEGSVTLCVTTEILSEYTEIIARFYSPTVADSFLTALLYSPFVERIEAYFHWHAITVDPDDDKFFDCAVAAGAQYIITHDRHFNVLETLDFPKVAVLRPSVFKQTLIT